MEENLDKETILKEQEAQANVKPALSKQEIIEGIFEETKQLTEKQASRKKKKEPSIVTLISGVQVDLNILTSRVQNHPPQFSQELYNEIYRVFHISGDPKQWHKDKRVPDFTNEFLYSSRYEEGVLNALRARNKYDPNQYCTRYNKHYQYFTADGIIRLQLYLSQTMEVLKDCEEEYEFRKKMFEKYNIPLQKDLFRD